MIWVATPDDMYRFLPKDLMATNTYLILSPRIMCSVYDKDTKNITNMLLNGNSLRGVPFSRDYASEETQLLYAKFMFDDENILRLIIMMLTYCLHEDIFIICRESDLETDWMWLFLRTFKRLTGYQIVRYPDADLDSFPDFERLTCLKTRLFELEFEVAKTKDSIESIIYALDDDTLTNINEKWEIGCKPHKYKKIRKRLVERWRLEYEPGYYGEQSIGFEHGKKHKHCKRSWWEI